jgi:PTH1 family peptidyl-tRNA hydrolase
MKLILGLGNIGSEYEMSRHNVGFLCLSAWSGKRKIQFKHERLFDYISHRNGVLIKPNTYMNRSGLALAEAIRRWNCTEAMVIHDDSELPLACLRLRNGGGDGGHNGVRSLLEILPADALKRVRVGIGRDGNDLKDYVLDDFSQEELDILQPTLQKACELIDIYLDDDFNSVLNAYSKWKKSCSKAEGLGNTSPKEKDNDQKL